MRRAGAGGPENHCGAHRVHCSTRGGKAFEKTPAAGCLKGTGVVLSSICPLMYMNNPLCGKMPVATSSNKLRTYSSARYYTDAEMLRIMVKGEC